MNDIYKKAYTEVLEILKYFPYAEYSKIPTEKIDFYKENMDSSYSFIINPNIDLEKQYISKEANAILVSLFNDYYANDKQKEILKNLLNKNQQRIEKDRYEKYNPDEIFKSNEIIEIDDIQENNGEKSLIKYKENFFIRFINFIKNIFKR